MFNNISGKLKVWAIITVIIGNISAIISGVSLISQGEGFGIIGIVIMFAGILSSWLTAWILFGLGDLIDTTDAIYSKVNKNTYDIEHISKNVEIIDVGTTDNYKSAMYVTVEPQRLDSVRLSSNSILYYEMNEKNAITKLVLSNVTGDYY